ncbi:hypothetical protein [Bosea sp. LC85]|uniref:hypothetical protein n=1 Tax=Bosea sp. LC85 TaxID=1502851 RepID=UPI0005B9D419|nr:hypothetical protein [Bosea sp. LC85]
MGQLFGALGPRRRLYSALRTLYALTVIPISPLPAQLATDRPEAFMDIVVTQLERSVWEMKDLLGRNFGTIVAGQDEDYWIGPQHLGALALPLIRFGPYASLGAVMTAIQAYMRDEGGDRNQQTSFNPL